MKGQGLLRRLGFALSGLALAFTRERSFRTHVLAGAAVLLASIVAVVVAVIFLLR